MPLGGKTVVETDTRRTKNEIYMYHILDLWVIYGAGGGHRSSPLNTKNSRLPNRTSVMQ